MPSLSIFKTVKSRLLIVVIVPLAIAVGLLLNNVVGYYRLSQEMDKLEPTIQLNIVMGTLIHEMQKERGMSVAFLTGAAEFRKSLDKQRPLVDQKRDELKKTLSDISLDHFSAEFNRAIESTSQRIAQVDGVRSKIDDRSMPTAKAIAYYTQTNASMIQVVKDSASTVRDRDMNRLSNVHVIFLQLKEKAGLERAVLSGVFALDRFTGKSLATFAGLISEQDSLQETFLSLSTEEESAYFKEQMKDPSFAEVFRLRDIAMSRLGNQDKAVYLSSLFSSIGYGGAIHQFKNYVLRQAPKYKDRFTTRYQDILGILDQMEANSVVTAAEKEHIAAIRKTIGLYNQATQIAADMIEGGASIRAVDGVIKISDSPAIKAMNALSQGATLGNFGVDSKHWFTVATQRIDQLKKVEDYLSDELLVQGKELGSSAQNTLIMISLLSIIVTIVVLGAIFMVLRSILNPLKKTTAFAQQLAQGDLTAKIDVIGDDEMGELMNALNSMVDSFRGSVEHVVEAIQKLMLTAEQTSTITEQTNSSVQTQLTETTKMADAIDQMNAMARDVSQNTSGASTAATDANREAAAGRDSMEATVSQIKQLASELQSSGEVISKLENDSIEIGTVLDVIKGISEQTNLLALNAAIEAARAGEQGRGFAVVADEVRTLASRTQDSAEEISQMISRLQEGARDAVAAISRGGEQAQKSVDQAVTTGENLTAISDVVSRMNDMNGQIASAVVEQNNVVEQINQNIGHINAMAQQTAGYSRETEDASNDLSNLTNALRESASQFKIN
ncbi:MAG: methyl-accepting chemotaxis protein [Gammaproteobacteria bacterium]|nr:methyl-accepting chemotaxis protein [Gammaproteobacteria bacterium]